LADLWPNPPAIALDTRRLGNVDIEALHRLGDCYVSLTRGEGWGRGAFDAATHGNPAIMTAYGGHLDFLGGSPGLVDFRMVRVDNPLSNRHSPKQRWAEPDVDHAAELLRSVLTDPVHRSWAKNRAQEIHSRYERRSLAEAYIDVVQTHRRHQGNPPAITKGIRWMSPGVGTDYGDLVEAAVEGLRSAAIPVTWSPLVSPEWDGIRGLFVGLDPTGSPEDDMSVTPIQYDTVVVHSRPVWNEWLEAEQDGHRVVACTPWSHDRLSEDQVRTLNRYDLVVVPSGFNVQTFMASGVTVPLAAVPPIARPVGVTSPVPLTGRLRFYTINTWSRKALTDTIAAYLDAFGPEDDVSLLVCAPAADQIALAELSSLGWAIEPLEGRSSFSHDRLIAGSGDHPLIELRTIPRTPDQIAEVHRSSHCFVSLTRSEGWDRSGFDAASHGNPVVVTGWGSCLDLLPEGYPFLVDFDTKTNRDDQVDDGTFPRPGRLPKARMAHASALLRAIYEQREAAWSDATAVALDLRARFNAHTAAARLLSALSRASAR